MTNVTAVVDIGSIRQGPGGAISGVIFFDIGDDQFPGRDWNDLIVVALRQWLTELTNANWRPGSTAVLRFFDGPFRVDVQRLSEVLVRIQFIHGSTGGFVVAEANIDLGDFLNSVCKAAKSVIAASRASCFDSDDIDALVHLTSSASLRK